MNIESFREHCLRKKGVTEEFPFDENTLVFKVMGKMFALTNIEVFARVSLKVDPEEGASLRDQYSYVQPAYHMNKKHWITVDLTEGVPERLLKKWVDDSYDLVVRGLTRSLKLTLDML